MFLNFTSDIIIITSKNENQNLFTSVYKSVYKYAILKDKVSCALNINVSSNRYYIQISLQYSINQFSSYFQI